MDECRPHHVLQEIVRLHEQLIRLSRESHDHIDSEKYLRPAWNLTFLPDVPYLVCKCSRVISASHRLENGIAAGLKRDMVVGEELCAAHYPVYHLLCQKVRLYG